LYSAPTLFEIVPHVGFFWHIRTAGGAIGGLGYAIGESTNANTNGISQQAAPGPLANALVASKVNTDFITKTIH
jgi:hypothetical protein